MNLQGTNEWLLDRCGNLTSSMIYDAVTPLKSGKESMARRNYRALLVAERLTGIPQGADLSRIRAIRWGIEQESNARVSYEFKTDKDVEVVGFVKHPTILNGGASPDGLIDIDGLTEYKCPNTATHIEYLRAGIVPEEYRPQMKWQLACTGRNWCDFVSYDPRLDLRNRLFIVRYEPTQQELEEIEREAIEFLQEVDEITSDLKGEKSTITKVVVPKKTIVAPTSEQSSNHQGF